MKKTTILAVIALFAVGFLGVHAYNGTLPQLITSVSGMAQPVVNMVQPSFTKIQTAWATIPTGIQQIILLAIPSMFAMFFAWTKLRVIESAKQAQIQATAAFNQVSGEASEAKQELSLVETRNTSLEQQLGQQSNLGFEEALKARDEAQSMVSVKAGELKDAYAVVKQLTEDNKRLLLENESLKPKQLL